MALTRPAAFENDAPVMTLAGEDATSALARWFAHQLGAGDVLLLDGPIGAGKSHFARALILELLRVAGAPAEEIPSPTYTIVQTYRAGKLEIWHTDLYRLATPDDVAELGLEAAFESALCLVEWPDRLGVLAPAVALFLQFGFADTDTTRQLRLVPRGPRAHALAEAAMAWRKAQEANV
jgi:tRNA threonylcarbamoyladenosine biosynthesis protein TsaE